MKHNEIIKIVLKNRSNISKSKILCIGDIILDQYIHGRVERLSPEAPIPILIYEKETFELGGVGNVASNISSLGGNVTIIKLFGSDANSKKINCMLSDIDNIKKLDIRVDNFQTPLKTRFINNTSHIVRVDRENKNFKVDKSSKKKILDTIIRNIKKHDLVLLSDYNKGFLDRELIKKIIKLCNIYKKIIIIDPKKIDLSIYSNADFITPNQKEITDAMKKKFLNEKNLKKYGMQIIRKYNIKNVLITRSEKGMLLLDKNYIYNYKAIAKKIIDVTGAGDTVLAVLGLMLAIGLDKDLATLISNFAASIVINKKGTSTMTYSDLK